MLAASYVLPLKSAVSLEAELGPYLRRLASLIDDVVVVDGSAPPVFERHAAAWGDAVRHMPPEIETAMGKVSGVLTGLRHARHERVVIADDDIRYDAASLARAVALLDDADVVRPQNVFRPAPWHARWDTGRSLLNRLSGGDWPGTLAVRGSALEATDGYRGDVLFENLELVRTVEAAGGRQVVPLDLFVERRPPTTRHFLSQRVRQAYDEWARPSRFAAQLALAPLAAGLLFAGEWLALSAALAAAVVVAEIGRRRSNGRSVYPPTAALWAPLWLMERAVTSWLAFGTRFVFGGVRYGDGRLRDAATSPWRLARIHTGTIRRAAEAATTKRSPGAASAPTPAPTPAPASAPTPGAPDPGIAGGAG